MLRLLNSWIASACLLWTCGTPVAAQAIVPKTRDVMPPAKMEEPRPYVRDNSSIMVYYSLASIAVLLILLLVCMPARRD